MSLVELIVQADERGLAASGLACLDRCVPLLGGDDDVLRPLWASLTDGEEWEVRLAKARSALDTAEVDDDEACVLARRMLGAAPAVLPQSRESLIGTPEAAQLREWADACSVAALQIHRILDVAEDGATSVTSRREGSTDAMSPLVAAELRRQITILELLSVHGASGLRQALDVSTEGRRVLRAVVSRRARGRV
ncbi:hypothetical protein H1V43_09115 [Streptomyces sp. PSKA54]|uniref:Uncharacterized protein n=1 Tax=Streptomyces himalayensis subsp. aureolus TaxID=2758039 RepID=A0A7W2HF50_9ACTN|nr:hypothetical protein [Streptomyces himalayensis]MBA4861542.1 hypothetical protein [Streptomyces himalayensis subsp. aureolus]